MVLQGAVVAIMGAGGLVGQTILQILRERNFPVAALKLGATARSAGKTVRYGDRDITVEEVTPRFFEGVDIAFFAASSEASEEWAPVAMAAGAKVIDKSTAFRMNPEVPLVVPEVNGHLLASGPALIASPNCSTIQLVVALSPLERQIGLKRVLVDTYQAVSGTGREALEELWASSRARLAEEPFTPSVYPEPIGFNVLPHCDSFSEGGFTKEEWKLMRETRRIIGREDLGITATAVRVPVAVSHSEAVTVELAAPVSVKEMRALLAEAPGVRLVDDPSRGLYPTAAMAAGQDDVLVGRIRKDPSSATGMHLWVVADNLRKGAATNAVQIAEVLWLRQSP